MRLEGKVAVVTGGARGLGASMCQLFAKEGAAVIAADMGEMTYTCEGVTYYPLNITDTEACRKFYEDLMATYGKIERKLPSQMKTPKKELGDYVEKKK